MINIYDQINSDMLICGVDEAGRGPLSGDVYAAAVVLDSNNPIVGLRDSKKLTAKRREELYHEIIDKALAYSITSASVEEIDRLNILQASLLAMQRCIHDVFQRFTPEIILVDGNKLPKIAVNCAMHAIIGGDDSVEAISAASILAKVSRDKTMIELDRRYPQYGFLNHKGYGTKEHMSALNEYGAIQNIHRCSFAPVARSILNKQIF